VGQALALNDLVMGLSKPFAFGLILSTVGCFMGLRTRGGTQGVGIATTQSVVVASVMILISDFFMTKILLVVFPVS
jgi:phospholipid/cholesterol/gamma-HCH transport system permease protein